MKSSIKFREEKSPLLRVKLPMKVGPIPISSGVTLGESPDLALQVGTLFPAGPSLRLAFKPHDQNPFSVILRMGLGSWGSGNDTALALTAELHLAQKGRDPLFSLRLKPKVGDFSIRKTVNFQKQNGASIIGSVKHNLPNGACHKPDHGALQPVQLNEDPKEIDKQSAMLHDKDGVRSPFAEPNNPMNGCVSPSKVAGLEREWKGRADRKLKLEGSKEHSSHSDTASVGNGMIVHVPDEILHEQMESERRNSAAVSHLMGLWRGVADCKVVAHSLLPLGNHARLRIRWGIKPSSELFHGWDGSLQSLTFSKLPSLLLDKVSFERISTPEQKPKEDALAGSLGYLEQGLYPEEHTELVKVAAMCYSMKRQLHLMYAENQVLRRAMEDMRSQAEFRGSISSWNSKPALIDTSIEEHVAPRWGSKTPVMDVGPRDAGESNSQELEARKNGRKKDAGMELKKSNSNNLPPSSDSPDLSKELEKAILGAKSNSPGGKKS